MILLILLLTSSLQSFHSLDQIFFHTSFSCHLTSKPSYNYSVRFVEDDGGLVIFDATVLDWIHDEYLAGGGVKTKNMYNTTVDGDTGPEYEFGVIIQHNCLLSGMNHFVKVLFTHGFCQIGKGDCHVYIRIDLTGMLQGGNRQVRIEQNAN